MYSGCQIVSHDTPGCHSELTGTLGFFWRKKKTGPAVLTGPLNFSECKQNNVLFFAFWRLAWEKAAASQWREPQVHMFFLLPLFAGERKYMPYKLSGLFYTCHKHSIRTDLSFLLKLCSGDGLLWGLIMPWRAVRASWLSCIQEGRHWRCLLKWHFQRLFIEKVSYGWFGLTTPSP